MTKDEALQVWAAASEYHWRGFEHWWEEKGRVAGWIKSSSKMPTENKDVLCANDNGVFIGFLAPHDTWTDPEGLGILYERWLDAAPYWQELPEAPTP